MPMQNMFQSTPYPPQGQGPQFQPGGPFMAPPMGGPQGGGLQFTSGGPLMPPGQQLSPQIQQILAQMQAMQFQPGGPFMAPPQGNQLTFPPQAGPGLASQVSATYGPSMPGVSVQPQPGIQPMPPGLQSMYGPPTMGPGQGVPYGNDMIGRPVPRPPVQAMPMPTPTPPQGRWRGPNKFRGPLTPNLPMPPSGGLVGMGGPPPPPAAQPRIDPFGRGRGFGGR